MHSFDSGSRVDQPDLNTTHPKRRTLASFWEASRISLDSIWSHKLRSFLTLLGIIIGVASVVSVGAAIEGLRKYVTDSLEGALGSNAIIVARIAGINMSYDDYLEMLRKHKPIRLEDMQIVRELCGDCEAISPMMNRNDNVKRESRIFEQARISGVNEDLLKMEKIDLESGRFITASDVMRAIPSAVIGIDIRDHRSKSLDDIDVDSVQLVITLCDEEVCPSILRPIPQLHWGMPDPAAVEGDSQVELSWNPNPEPNLDYYVVFRDTAPNPTDSLAAVPAPATTYLDLAVENDTTYYYRIKAIDTEANASPYSDQVSAMPHA